MAQPLFLLCFLLSVFIGYPSPADAQQAETSNGVVKGPKTMPAVKKQGVESEVLFAPDISKQSNLLDRAQPKPEDIKAPQTEQIVSNQEKYDLLDFISTENGQKKFKINFNKNSQVADKKQKDEKIKLIASILTNKPNSRLQIKGYVTKDTNQMIALSHAMSVRHHLISQNIAPHRIDVRTINSQTVETMDNNSIDILIVEH